jgi:hypothetical protein
MLYRRYVDKHSPALVFRMKGNGSANARSQRVGPRISLRFIRATFAETVIASCEATKQSSFVGWAKVPAPYAPLLLLLMMVGTLRFAHPTARVELKYQCLGNGGELPLPLWDRDERSSLSRVGVGGA